MVGIISIVDDRSDLIFPIP